MSKPAAAHVIQTHLEKPTDPVELVIANALEAASVEYCLGRETGALDFYLPSYRVHIECKRLHTERITKQMARFPDVIAIQGMDAALAFADMIKKGT